jgi:DNA-binding response OmpR family regulator
MNSSASPVHETVILVVEPDAMLRDLMELAINRLAFNRPIKVLTAAGEADSLTLFKQAHPALVILDLFLSPASQASQPEPLSALDLISVFRAGGGEGRTRVIAVSSLGYREIVQQAIVAGASDFIIKPFDVEEFILRVQAALR